MINMVKIEGAGFVERDAAGRIESERHVQVGCCTCRCVSWQ